MQLNHLARAILFLIGLAGWFLGPDVSKVCAEEDSLYQKFLDQYVVPDRRIGAYRLNVVDYDGIVSSRSDPGSLYQGVLSRLAAVKPEALGSRDEKIAFWINAYNVGAIKMIVDHYPVDSIRSTKIHWLRNPWGKKIITVDGRDYSLGEIEHDILMGAFKEPMTHFGIVCASLSCPDLSRRAYRGATVHEQLRAQARRFLGNQKRGLRLDREGGQVFFTRIFKFDDRSFPGGARDAVPFIAPLLEGAARDFLVSGNYRVDYLDYDWSLNALSRAR